jgi:hypothetical protein
VIACGGDGADLEPTDAGRDGGAPDAFLSPVEAPSIDVPSISPDAPVLPAPLELGPCVEGWMPAMTRSGGIRCEPWPTGEQLTCPPDQGHFPGESGCVSVGTSCGEWPTDLPAGIPAFYVRTTTIPGTGTIDAPFGTIAEALAVARAPAVIALGPNDFDERFELGSGISVIGTCTERTRIAPSTPNAANEFLGAIHVVGIDASIRNLTISGARYGISNRSSAGFRVEDVVISGVSTYGVWLYGSGTEAELDSVIVRRTRLDGTQRGNGLFVTGGANVEVRRTLFEDNHGTGALFVEAGRGSFSNVAVLRTARPAGAGGEDGFGFLIKQGSEVSLNAVVVEDVALAGLAARDSGRLEAEDVVVRGAGYGAYVFNRGELALSKLYVADNDQYGLYAYEGSIDASRILVEGSPTSVMIQNSTLTGEHLEIINSEEHALSVTGAQARAEIDGLWIDTNPNLATGIDVTDAASFRAEHAAVFGAHSAGLVVQAAECSMSDVGIYQTKDGAGVVVQRIPGFADSITWLTLERAAIEDNELFGVRVEDPGSSVVLSHVRVSGNGSQPGSAGISVTSSASFEGRDLLLENNRYAGIIGKTFDAELLLERVEIRGTTRVDDVPLHFASGLVVERAHARVDRLISEGNEDVGMLIFEGRAELTGARFAAHSELDLVVWAGTATLSDVSCTDSGGGVLIWNSSDVVAQRVAISSSREVAFSAGGASRARIVDLSIEGTESRADDGRFGYALAVQDRARVSLERGSFRDSRVAAVFVSASFVATDFEIEGTREAACASMACDEISVGLAVVEGSAELSRFRIAKSGIVGLIVGPSASIELEAPALISESALGASVLNPSIPDERFDVLSYEDVRITLDRKDQSIPMPRLADVFMRP